ncbi:hypothetical protein FQA39_LY02641 [Lamprigera yunnana]|nr:hypothetical protein FQA39_LY02641 [Lamprigera yunnana]
MCEVTTKNFDQILPECQDLLKKAKFISIDTEFSCLTSHTKLRNSLFDSAQNRYTKQRQHIQQVIPFQIGLTAFTFDPDRNVYKGHVYNFYVFPRSFTYIDRKFLCQASSFTFLAVHDFDFNKLVTEGIPYINRVEENELRNRIKTTSSGDIPIGCDFELILKEYSETIFQWIKNAKYNDNLLLKKYSIVNISLDLKYFLKKRLCEQFQNIWIYEHENGFMVKKISEKEYQKLISDISFEENLISTLLGFTKVFRYIQSLKKPIVGHNFLLDLMLIVHNLEQPLPKAYSSFKKLINDLFPTIYDTKCMSYDIIRSVPPAKRYRKNTLQNLFIYFKDEHGRHLASNSPSIEHQHTHMLHDHEAGWDSFCTGYIFLRMAHFEAASKAQVKSKIFMSTELFQAVSYCKNRVNLIRGNISYLQLDGSDPISTRPPWLIIKTTKKRSINIKEVAQLLSSCGFAEIRPYSRKGALIAVDNFSSVSRILSTFRSNSDFKIQQYHFLKHSPVISRFLWSGAILSGAVLAWYAYLKFK